MKLEIDLENSSLSEFLNEDEDGNVTFTDAFKQIIINEVFTKAKFDDDIRKYIKENIKDGLWKQIVQYKQEAAIKGIVDDVIREELKANRSGSLIFTDVYISDVKSAVKKHFDSYKSSLERAVREMVEIEVKDCLDDIYDGCKIKEFFDMEKMASYIIKNMERKGIKKET